MKEYVPRAVPTDFGADFDAEENEDAEEDGIDVEMLHLLLELLDKEEALDPEEELESLMYKMESEA